MRKSSLGTLVLCLLVANSAYAWGPEGHRMVCRIAFLLLDDADRAEVVRLTAAYVRPDGAHVNFFTDGCVFPDEARDKARKNVPGWDKFDPFDQWHFLNLPRTSVAPAEDDCPAVQGCVLTGIARHSTDLRTAATDQERAEALFFLGHWLGDIHQPLHVSFSSDQGGNLVKPILGGFYQSGSLHSVWDSGILLHAIGDDGWRPHADKLKDAITPAAQAFWLASETPLEWATESYVLTTTPATDYCAWTDEAECAPEAHTRTLGQQYQDAFADDVEMRIQQAGVRLAELLRKNLRRE